jgi:hypothetical protein
LPLDARLRVFSPEIIAEKGINTNPGVLAHPFGRNLMHLVVYSLDTAHCINDSNSEARGGIVTIV